MDIAYTVLGLVVGLLVGMTGVGGGSLLTPALTLFGINPAVAVGTDLVFAAITKGVGTVVHRAQSSVDWRIAGLLAAGSCPAAAITVGALAATPAVVRQFRSIKESKQLSPEARERWYARISLARVDGLRFAASFVSANVIDRKGIVFAIRLALMRSLKKL